MSDATLSQLDDTLTRRYLWIFVLSIAATIGLIYLHVIKPEILGWLTREDGVFEYTSAIFYFVAAGAMIWSLTLNGKINIWILGFAILFFVIFGEEISWGQRILSIEAPEFLQSINVQNELNIHNIDGIHQTIRMFATLFVIATCFIIPLLNRFSTSIKTLIYWLRFPVMSLHTMPIAGLAILFMAVPRLLGLKSFRFDEVGEFYLSVTYLVFAFDVAIATKQAQT